MKTPNEILKWLKANLGRRAIAPLTSTDTFALVTSVNLSNLIGYQTAPPELFKAYHAIVSQMQEHNRHLAYHAIAMELDWSHRNMIWTAAEYHTGKPLYEAGMGLRPKNLCCFEYGGGGEERSKQLQKA
jgi:hypothetical protein